MGIQLPRVAKCCCCIPLRVGSLIIGYFSILASCFTIAAISFYTYRVVVFVKDNTVNPNPEHSPEEVQKMALNLYLSFGYYMVVFLYNLIINVLLIVGVHMNKPQYLKVYINTAYFLIVLAIVLIILTSVFMGFLATIPLLKWTFIQVMCVIVIRSTYLEMEEQNNPRTIEMQDLYMPQQAPLMA